MISHRDPLKSEFFEKSQMSESIDVPSGCVLQNIIISDISPKTQLVNSISKHQGVKNFILMTRFHAMHKIFFFAK